MKKLNQQFNKFTKLMQSVFMVALVLFASSCNVDKPMPEPELDIVGLARASPVLSTFRISKTNNL